MTTARTRSLVLVLMTALMLTACGGSTSADPPAATATLVPGSATAVPADAPGPDGVDQPAAPTTPALAAQVNGTPIYLADFQRALAREESNRLAFGLPIPEDRALFEREVLDQMIEAVLIEQAAAAIGFTLSEAELDAEMVQSIEDAGGSEGWNDWLIMSHLTPEEYRRQLYTQLIGSMVTAQIAAEVPEVAEQVHARHILVDEQGDAEEILNQLSAGADFAELARNNSIDASTRDAGGDLSWFMRGQLLESAVEDAAFGLQPGQVSDVITSRLGYHIVQTLERDPAHPLSDVTRQEMVQLAIERWRQGLWENAVVQRFVGAGR